MTERAVSVVFDRDNGAERRHRVYRFAHRDDWVTFSMDVLNATAIGQTVTVTPADADTAPTRTKDWGRLDLQGRVYDAAPPFDARKPMAGY